MNINYTTSGTNCTYTLDSSSCSGTPGNYIIRYYEYPTGVLVSVPENWFPEGGESPLPDSFARLINEETNTGWKIQGYLRTLREYPPGLSRITLAQYKKLILRYASPADTKRINEWFENNKIEELP